MWRVVLPLTFLLLGGCGARRGAVVEVHERSLDELIAPDQTYLVAAGNVQRSMMHFRMNSTEEGNRMPLLGRSLVHEEGVDLLRQFISSISTCD